MKKYVKDDESATFSSSEKLILDILELDIVTHPERMQPITADLARRAQSLVGSVSVDLDLPLPPDDA